MARMFLIAGTILLLTVFGITYAKGLKIQHALKLQEKEMQVSEVKVSARELSCMAKNIYHEARGEPIEGQLAVAIVTLNRVNHKDFPNDICSVVYQRTSSVCQFSWVCDKSLSIRDLTKFVQSVEIARIAIEGRESIDQISKALYYHADYVNPRWNHKTKVAKIGRHIFYEYRV
jgi:spore germination cell wall hydrolase CwlJ-like protein